MSARALRMTWTNLAFLHWPVSADVLRPLVPARLEIDAFDGSAWVAVVPFEMHDVQITGLPQVPGAADFPELNVRTYVRNGDRTGVWFFSLDAASWLAVAGARAATGLAYYHATMSVATSDAEVAYESDRTHPGAAAATLRARYRADGGVFRSTAGSFEHWCTERYSLYSLAIDRTLLRVDIAHEPWPLQRATADITANTMAAASGITLPAGAPHALFAQRLDVTANWPVSAR